MENITIEDIILAPGSNANQSIARIPADASRILRKAVVVEVFNDLSNWPIKSIQSRFGSISQEDQEYFSGNDPFRFDRVSNPQYLDNLPRNSAIVRPITEGYDLSNSPLLTYPFFSSHLCMPIKPGEQVWIISEVGFDIGSLPLWVCRVPEPLQVEDLNFSHGDRKYGSSEFFEPEQFLPNFPNGEGNNIDQVSLRPVPSVISSNNNSLENQQNSYDRIIEKSISYGNFTPEVVPTLTKRVGDLVLQGSNNTAIILGEDRGYTKNEEINPNFSNASSNYVNLPKEKGTIDLVAGRGRYFNFLKPTGLDSKGNEPEQTQARTIISLRKNGSAYIENDKNPEENNFDFLPQEGDPDLIRDCSRVYISMKTNGDENFGITSGSFSIPNGFENPIKAINNSPYTILKSDEVRIIARKDLEHEINGSIRIIKEGKNNEDLGAIVILPDGTIQVSGSKIFIGRTPVDGGNGTGPGPSESQPYVRYKDLEDLWSFFMDELDKFCDTMLTHTTPGYGNPSPQIIKAVTDLKNKISLPVAEEGSEITSGGLKESIVRVKSKRIFGE
jgi:hypothetical protein